MLIIPKEDVWEVIQKYHKDWGEVPPAPLLRRHFGIKHNNTIYKKIKYLEQDGLVRIERKNNNRITGYKLI